MFAAYDGIVLVRPSSRAPITGDPYMIPSVAKTMKS